MLKHMIFLTNVTLDADNWEEVRRLGLPMGDHPDDPLTPKEWSLLEEQRHLLPNLPNFVDMSLAHSVLLHGVKCACPTLEFAFRNDFTRHQYGTPTELETHLPDMTIQTSRATMVQHELKSRLSHMGGHAAVHYNTGNADRHFLYICIPFDWLFEAGIEIMLTSTKKASFIA